MNKKEYLKEVKDLGFIDYLAKLISE